MIHDNHNTCSSPSAPPIIHHHPTVEKGKYHVNRYPSPTNIPLTGAELPETDASLPKWTGGDSTMRLRNLSFLYKFKAAIGGHRSKPDVFPIVTTALTTNSAGGGSQALKVLVAWTSPFLPSTFFPSCLEKQIMMGSFSSLDFSPSAPGVREYFPQGEC